MHCPVCRSWNEQLSPAHGLPPVGQIGICLLCGELVALAKDLTLRRVGSDEIAMMPWLAQFQSATMAAIATRQQHRN